MHSSFLSLAALLGPLIPFTVGNSDFTLEDPNDRCSMDLETLLPELVWRLSGAPKYLDSIISARGSNPSGSLAAISTQLLSRQDIASLFPRVCISDFILGDSDVVRSRC